jgi:hypothetical protein
MKLKLLAAALLAGVAFSASADDQSIAITLGQTYDFDDVGTILSGGSDTITFTGLAAGSYDVVLSYSGNYVNLSSVTLNSAPASYSWTAPSGKFTIGGFDLATGSPFNLVLTGSPIGTNVASYSGQITVTAAVPEPATYGMLLGGLGLLGMVARRKKQS